MSITEVQNSSQNTMEKFITKLRVRYHEMDALGHVNNAVYQHYLEQAAVEHSEHLGFNQQRCEELGGIFVMRRIEIDYLRPAVAGDTLEITTWLQTIRGPRAIRCYEIRHQSDDKILVKAEALWVWVDFKTMRPKAIPSPIIATFEQTNLLNVDNSQTSNP